MIDSEHSVAIVTGASTGIGRAVAIALARDRFSVLVNSKTDVDGGAETVAEVEARGGQALYCRADVSSVEGAERVACSAASLGHLRVLVNNAGATRGCSLGEWTAAHWRDMLDTNLLTTALMSQAFLGQLRPGAEAAIINIASIRGLPDSPRLGAAAYCAAKAGVISLTKALSQAAPPHVTVNAISPGFVATTYMNRVEPGLKAGWLDSMPIDRFIEPDEVAEVTRFLVAQRSMTGANIVMDGGWTVGRA